MAHMGHKESGAISIATTITIAGIVGLIIAALNLRSTNELKTAQHADLISEQAEVKGIMNNSAVCPDPIPAECKLGDRLEIFDSAKNLLISKSGDRKIAKWNVKVECAAKKAKKEYWLLASRFSGETKDPLTGKLLSWVPVSPLKDFCPSNAKDSKVVLSNICYGTVTGNNPLPSDLGKKCKGKCEFQGKFCADNQINFPECPAGSSASMHFSDRFGWGGIDIAKTTVCERSLASKE